MARSAGLLWPTHRATARPSAPSADTYIHARSQRYPLRPAKMAKPR
jgi:hypothetical protein